ncbi:MAG TPA: PKD domain-containing protein [Methanothrix sp.]|nr:PKD domain-containing protein [Methanothrix sp.]
MIPQSRKCLFSLIILLFLLSFSLPITAALSLSGTAFQDANGDGFFSPGEQTLANITIGLSLDGNATNSACTNESGGYSFDNLSPGSYELTVQPSSGSLLTAPGSGSYVVTLSDMSASGLDWGFFAPQASAAPAPRTYPIMHPTQREASLWAGQYNSSARAYLSPEIEGKMASEPVAAFSLLDLLRYTPSERDQGTCGNCWAWAGTGVMELDYARQKGVSDRLSVQYLASSYNGGCGENGACCGGWLSDLAGFYQDKKIMVPWSNSNAHYRDGKNDCGACSSVPASFISTEPHYELSAISSNTIPTHNLSREEAISNIKNVLLQGKGIWFGYFLPDKRAWDDFFSFWGSQPESAVWQPDGADGRTFDYRNGGGHAVLCVGYDESDPNNRYWIMLNSWGKTAGRPSGLFRMSMDMNYNCSYADLGNAFFWMTLDISYPEKGNQAPQAPSEPQGSAKGAALSSLSFAASANDPEGDPVRFSFDWGDGTSSETELAPSGASVSSSHSWEKPGTYYVQATAIDEQGGQSPSSARLAVMIYENSPPNRPSPPMGVAAGYVNMPYSFKGYATDTNQDLVAYIFDWGDGSTSQSEMVDSGTSVQMSHGWSQAGSYQIKIMAVDGNNAKSQWSASRAVKIRGAVARSGNQAAPRTRTERAGQVKETCPCSRNS